MMIMMMMIIIIIIIIITNIEVNKKLNTKTGEGMMQKEQAKRKMLSRIYTVTRKRRT
jgi:competence protein ComGC